jgi:hypothetical protein
MGVISADEGDRLLVKADGDQGVVRVHVHNESHSDGPHSDWITYLQIKPELWLVRCLTPLIWPDSRPGRDADAANENPATGG